MFSKTFRMDSWMYLLLLNPFCALLKILFAITFKRLLISLDTIL